MRPARRTLHSCGPKGIRMLYVLDYAEAQAITGLYIRISGEDHPTTLPPLLSVAHPPHCSSAKCPDGPAKPPDEGGLSALSLPIGARSPAPQLQSETQPDCLFLTCPSAVSVQPHSASPRGQTLHSGSLGFLEREVQIHPQRIIAVASAFPAEEVPIAHPCNAKHHRAAQDTARNQRQRLRIPPRRTRRAESSNTHSASKRGAPWTPMTPGGPFLCH